MAPRVPWAVSDVRLAVAVKAMTTAETLEAVIAAKDKAKAAGLAPRDTEKLKTHFATHVARFRTTPKE